MNEINKKVHLIIEMCMELSYQRVEVFSFSYSNKNIISVHAFTSDEIKDYEFRQMRAYLNMNEADSQLDAIINKLNEYRK